MDYDYEDLAEEYENEDYGMWNSKSDPPEPYMESMVIRPPVSEIVYHCLIPTVGEAAAHLGKLLFYCTVFRLVVEYGPLRLKNLTSVICGAMILYHFFGPLSWYLVAHGVITYLTLQISHIFVRRSRGVITAGASLAFLLTCELFVVLAQEWHTIRGAQMLIAMKAISVGFDIDSGHLQSVPMPMDFFGYVFCVGSAIFGPWTKYSDYAAVGTNKQGFLGSLWRISSSSLTSLLFLSVSTCWTFWLAPNGSYKWLIAYRDALSFRSSHYFVSKMAEASSLTCDLQRQMPASSKKDDKTGEDGTSVSTSVVEPIVVSKPTKIEFPRSLVEVVVCWNIPMHQWLRTYVFKNARHLGTLPSILCTYGVSALLHGLNFQLAAVLLSLGFYTYTEYILRSKLAYTFSACIEARSCTRCDHKYKESHFMVRIANLFFTMIAVFHLIYLGFMFNSAGATEEEGYNIHHTLAKWRWLNYSSHWLVLITFVVGSVL